MIPKLYLNAMLDLLTTATQPVWLRLTGNSMTPLLSDGDLLLVQPGNAGIRVGDIVVFQSSHGQYAHRTLRILHGRKLFLTKGDNSYSFDPPVPSNRVLAKVLRAKGAHGTLELDSMQWCFFNHLIALYSYAEGQRHLGKSASWRLLDRIITSAHAVLFRRFHRHHVYRCFVTRFPQAVIKGGLAREEQSVHEEDQCTRA